MLLAGCRSDETCTDATELQNGAFSHYLLESIYEFPLPEYPTLLDLIKTTSDKSNFDGFGMKVKDMAKAQGSIIGKAVTGLKANRMGTIRVWVNLQ